MLNKIFKIRDNIYNFFLNLTIFNKIFYGTVFISIFLILFSSIISYTYSRIYFEDKITENTAILVKNINRSFEANVEQLERIIMLIYTNKQQYGSNDMSLKSIISTKKYNNIGDQYKALQIVNNFFQQLIILRNDISNIFMYISPEKNFSYSSKGRKIPFYDPRNTYWFKETLEADGKTVIFPPHKPYQLINDSEVISLSKLIKNIDIIKGEPYGVFMIDLSLHALRKIIESASLGNNSAVLFLDNNHVIYSHNINISDKEINTNFINKMGKSTSGKFVTKIGKISYLIAFSNSEITGWKLLTLTPYAQVTKESRKLLFAYIILIIIAILTSALLSFTFTRLLYRPINEIYKGIVKVENGDLDFQIEYISNDELGKLVKSFNSMILTTKRMILERYEEKLARNDAEIKYLQAQINPHFIYNTLQIISSIAVVKKIPEINIIAKNLGRLLRYRISTNNNIISISEEINNVVSYLDIQKMRFKEFLNYETYIDEVVENYSIIKLVLQPIVENSITHGLEKKGKSGLIKIAIRYVKGEIFINVWDNGIGMDLDEIKNLDTDINSPEEETNNKTVNSYHNNVGLRNINRRIQLIYGSEYKLKIESEKGQWTRISFNIPAFKLSKVTES